ncbi:hypothetical protein NT239_05075 [Chitinibacter sp. SCUT-21]|uniref:hypothetical protein n=1 Tax=Chitinibacter sp. SCUT-21 TaxID=2970891 RepID=UPI0035A58F0D
MNTTLKMICAAASLTVASFALAAPSPVGGHAGMPKGDVTKADFLKHMEERFNMMDANKDGVLSEAERKAAHDKMRAMRDERRQARMASKASMAK